MKKTLTVMLSLALLLAAYLALWPVPIEPVAWRSPPASGYTGAHAANQRLAGLQHIDLKGERGPEHVAMGPDGKLYTAVASGKVLRMNPDGSALEVFAQPGGRILGFDFDAAGHLIGADAERGVVSIDPNGQVRLLADRVGSDPIRFANSVVVARTGKIYLTDSSTRFSARSLGIEDASLLEVIEQSASGRVLEFDPATHRIRTLAGGFAFANGVALSQDERWLFVADLGRYRIWKIDVLGATQPSVLLDNLPGYPDNLMRGQDGRIWVGLFGPRSAEVDDLTDKPFLRKVIMRLPRPMWPLPRLYGHVFAFTEDGKVVADLQDPSGTYGNTTGATETAERIYVANLNSSTLGWLPKAAR